MNQFVQLERVGNGYFMKAVEGRTDTVGYVDKFVVGASMDFNTGVNFEDFAAMVVGYNTDGVGSMGVWMVQDVSDGTWHIKSGAAGGAAAFVNVLFMNYGLVRDEGVTSQA